MAGAQLEVELREWLDRLAVQDLIYRYSDAVTRADWQQCEAVFAPDAIWESPILGLRYESRALFLEILRATSTHDLLIQTPHSSVIELMGADRARATTTIHQFARGVGVADTALGEAGAESNFEQYGIYFDDSRKLIASGNSPTGCSCRYMSARAASRATCSPRDQCCCDQLSRARVCRGSSPARRRVLNRSAIFTVASIHW
jgi:SnoaL-like protein